MKAILLAALLLWISAAFGWTLLGRVAVIRSRNAERFIYGATLGLCLAAYGVQALGLLGLLSFAPVTALWGVMAVVGLPGMRGIALATAKWGRGLSGSLRGAIHWLSAVAPLLLGLCLLIAIVCSFFPPTGMQWDSLAYHLASPKVFLQQGRISSLPTDHHSNFPFTLEMLFTVGLLYEGYALANLFHGMMGVLTAGAIYVFCRRHLSIQAGWIGAILFATTPVVLWEASVSYIELGLGLCTTLAAFAAIEGAGSENESERTQWAALAGALIGFALGMKYLALLPFFLTGGYLLLRRLPLRAVGAYVALALLIGSPWYVKNILTVQNPVYPFLYGAFKNTKYWSQDRAEAYQSEQKGFGYPHSLQQPAETIRNLIQTPWNLLANAHRYSNAGEYTFAAWIGGLYTGLAFAFVLLRNAPRPARDVFLIAGAQVLAWFFVAQIGRYLVAILPLLAVTGGYAAARWTAGRGSPAVWASRAVVGAVFTAQVAILLWGVLILPVSPRSPEIMPTALSVSETLEVLSEPDGREKRLQRSLELYGAMDWINKNAPKDAGVVLYEDARGFYLDRPYLWGNRLHSSYIPYDSMRSAEELTAWMRSKNIRYALINLTWTPAAYRKGIKAPNQQELEALRLWYAEQTDPPETWRRLLNEAIRTQRWKPVYWGRSVVVLEME